MQRMTFFTWQMSFTLHDLGVGMGEPLNFHPTPRTLTYPPIYSLVQKVFEGQA